MPAYTLVFVRVVYLLTGCPF